MTEQRRSRGTRDSGARDRLISAARTCLRHRGVSGSSSRLITETAGANLGAITYYFGSKDDLLAEALADELRDWIQPALDRLAEPGDPVSRLLGAVTVLNDMFEQQRDRVPGLLEAFVHASREQESRGPIAAIWAEARTQLAAVISELQARRAIPTWVQPEPMAALIVAVAAGTVVNETVAPGGIGHRDLATQFTSLLINARTNA
jgi:AcrR family transcriptional regulator